MKHALPLAAALVLSACATVSAAPSPTAAIGQIATVGGLRVRPLEIVEDSRCPVNVVCVWAGRLTVRAEVSKRRFRQTRNLTLGEPQAVPGGQLTLVSAEPGKFAGPQPALPAPRFTFKFDAK